MQLSIIENARSFAFIYVSICHQCFLISNSIQFFIFVPYLVNL